MEPNMLEPPSPAVLAIGKMENCFRDAADLIERYLTDGAAPVNGAAQISTLHLVSRSLADLRCGQYLIGEGFVIQMASVVRPVLESLNLIELFAREPDTAQQWADGNWREFMPARVRERLGVGKDPVYEWLSEMSHPRFAGFQMTMYRIVRDVREGEPQSALMYIGGLPLELPLVLNAAPTPSNALCLLALQLGHAPVTREMAWTWGTVARQVTETVLPGHEEIARVLSDLGGDDEILTAMLEGVNAALHAAREMEEIMREERERVGE